jgi:hypothetical protein
MTLTQLSEIIRTADKAAITEELKRLGYVDCTTDNRYKKMILVTLYKGNTQEVDEILYNNETKAVDGTIITNVKGYEQTEFIEVDFYRIQPTVFPEEEKTAIQESALIFAKEMTK